MEEMRKNRKLLIAIISIIVFIILVVIGLLIFNKVSNKNKKMFYKYSEQANLNSFLNDEKMKTYSNRLATEKHSTEGKISFKIGDEVNEKYEFAINKDPENKFGRGTFKLVQDGEEKLRILYLRQDSIYAFKPKNITKKYIAIRNDETINEFLQKLGLDGFNNLGKSKDSINNLINKAKEVIPEKNFSKIKEEQVTVGDQTITATGYKLNLTSAEAKNIIEKCMEEANKGGYENLINTLNDLKKSMENAQFNLTYCEYIKDEKLVKTYIKLDSSEENEQSYIDFSLENNRVVINYVINNSADGTSESSDNFTILIENNSTEDQEKYDFKLTQKDKNNNDIDVINGELSISNLSSQNVDYKAKITTSLFGEKIKIDLSATTVFGGEVEQKELAEDDYIVLNDLTGEQLSNLVDNLENEIIDRIDYNRSFIGALLSIINNFKTDGDLSETYTGNQVYEGANEGIERNTNSASEQVIEMFNMQFEPYEGSVSGSTLRSLISKIQVSNAQGNNKIEYDKSIEIDNSSTYNVSFEKDSQGYINRINVTY